jgi:hypothetical protein
MNWYDNLSSKEDIDIQAREMAGNWKKFSDFGWHRRHDLEDPDNWMIFYTHNRESGLMEESNHHIISQALNRKDFADDVMEENHSHWACGWVAGFAIRCLDKEGHATPAFREVVKLSTAIADYPLLDDSDYSQREYDAALESIEQEGGRLVKEGAPEDWAKQVFSYLWEKDQSSLENHDDRGACPSEESIRKALKVLNLLEEDEWDE